MKKIIIAMLFLSSIGNAETIYVNGKPVEFYNREQFKRESVNQPTEVCTETDICQDTNPTDLQKIKDYKKDKKRNEKL